MAMNFGALFSPDFGVIAVTNLHDEDPISAFVNFSNDLASPLTYFHLFFFLTD